MNFPHAARSAPRPDPRFASGFTLKTKLVLACALILALALLAPGHGFTPAAIARLLLCVLGLAALAFWARRRTLAAPKLALTRRLAVAAKTGLSPRCGVALVEADGRTYLVAFGDGFAQIHETPAQTGGAR